MAQKVNHEELKKLIKHYYNSSDSEGRKPSLFLWGRFGIGKCLEKNSEVATVNGKIKIKDIAIGEQVYGFDENGKLVVADVTNKFEKDNSLLKITTEVGTIECSPEHHFLTNCGWKKAKDLNTQMTVLDIVIQDEMPNEMDKIRRKKIAKALEDRENHKRNCLKDEENRTSYNPQEMEIESHKAESELETKECMEEKTIEIRDSVFSRDNRWRRDNNSRIRRDRAKKSSELIPLCDNIQYFRCIDSLVIKSTEQVDDTRQQKVQSRFSKTDTDKRICNHDSDEGSISISDSKKTTMRVVNEVSKIKDGKQLWSKIYRRRNENILENKGFEFKSEKILRIERTGKTERTYDITTTCGNYIANNILVHNSGVVKQVAQQIAISKNKEYIEWNDSTIKEKEAMFENPEKYFCLIDVRLAEMDTSDIKGLPVFKDDKKSIEFKVPYWALLLTEKDSDGILFLDEINLAPPLVMSAAYKIIYDKVVDDSRINPNWLVLGAGNTTDDKAYTHDVAAPLLDRGGEVELMGANNEDWSTWAMNNNIDSKIIGFINFKSSNLFKVDFEDKQKFTTYRGWERVSNLIKGVKHYNELDLITSSAIGEGVAKEFVAFCKIQEQINLDEVVKHPEKIEQLKEVSVKYFLTTALADKYKDGKIKFDKVLECSKVFDKINNAEFVALLWRMCYAYNKSFKNDFLSKVDSKMADKYAKFII